MNLFNDVALTNTETKNPRDWTIDDCRENLTVIFRESKNANVIDVSVRLNGLTMLKLHEGKTTVQIPSGSLSKQQILERVRGADNVLEEAKERLIESLNKARTSREINYKRKPKNALPPKREKDSQDFAQPSYSN
tara:strand:+ start:249 stop:653 length:405 start_codon:yes stop_codon:yes gene_type:complete